MARYFGVICKSCGGKIALAECRPALEGKIVTFNVIPLEPIGCTLCGESNRYEPSDGFRFDGPDDLPLSSLD